MNRQIYIHYGAKQFDPLLNFPIKNEHFQLYVRRISLILRSVCGLA